MSSGLLEPVSWSIMKCSIISSRMITFFAERIISTWNSLPHDSIDFSSLHAFKRGIEEKDFSRFLCLY